MYWWRSRRLHLIRESLGGLTMHKKTYQNWWLDLDESSILWLTLDQKEHHVNTLNYAVIEEFGAIIDGILEKQKELKGVILRSGKSRDFIVGVDIHEFTRLNTQEEATTLARKVQNIFDKWERLSIPTVAMIHGLCLGGGLELALACHYRIASSHPSTLLAAPEVKLGIHPGFGGTVRLVHSLGVFKAMSLMLTGRTIDAKKARKFGLVDAAVPERVLASAAVAYIHKRPYHQQAALWLTLIEAKIFRPIISRYFYSKLAKKVKKSHYPAPYVIVNRWGKDGALGANAMLNEAKSVSRLLFTHTSQELVRLFFLQEQLKAFGKKVSQTAQQVHIIGAGTMGSGIAAQCLLNGLKVSLQDSNKQQLSKAIKAIYREIDRTAKKDAYVKQKLGDALFPDLHGDEIKKADVVIEAIFEDLEAKTALFKQIEPQLKPNAILATNTSTIPLASLGAAISTPHRLIGIHFFNPPTQMQLVEVVLDSKTSSTEADKALAFVKQIGRLPLPVKSAPGFLVNRLLMPYLMESMLLVEEGFSPMSVDTVAKNFGMPIGPLALLDKIGLDVCLNAAQILSSHFNKEIPEILYKQVKKGNLGCKTQKGFYTYNKHGEVVRSFLPIKKPSRLPSDAKDRLILPMFIEAINCLKEKVVSDTNLLDAGIVFGAGFAPFRGGIIQYAVTQGLEKQVALLKNLQSQYGPRFKIDRNWKKVLMDTGGIKA